MSSATKRTLGTVRNIEIAFGRVDRRLLTLERVILPHQPPGR